MKEDKLVIGYDVASPDSEDMSCMVQFCGNCNSFIDVTHIVELKGDSQKEREESIKELETLKACPKCNAIFKTVHGVTNGRIEVKTIKSRK